MKKSFLVVFMLAMGLPVLAQHYIKGSVSDARTNAPLPQSSIFVSQLHRGAYAGTDGSFSIARLPAGTLLVEITHVGYKSKFVHVTLPGDSLLSVILEPSFLNIQEVVVTGSGSQAPEETIFNIAQQSQEEIKQSGALSLTDALSRIPGVSQLTTGAGISKPVIRGLYGNRIQVNLNGLRFDNQQWQDEHGLGLSDMGVDRVEIIRGPASVLYGSDAMGGVLNIIAERPAPIGTRIRDLEMRLHSNTLGLSVNYGSKRTEENRWKRFRIGFDNHADYSDGNSQRVLNSRFATYNVQTSWGKNKSNGTRVINLTASHSMFGFVFDSLSRKALDGRMSRTFDGPHHTVSFVQAGSENTYFKKKRVVKLNFGVTSNLRLEDEGGGGISLSMLLNSVNGLFEITQPVGASDEWRYGGNIFFQSNTNFGGRIIIPDAITGEASAFTYYRHRYRKLLLEAGARYDRKLIETFATKTLNVVGNESPTQEIVPFTRFYNAFNISLGAIYNLATNFSMKVNASSAYRPGNLAELSSNGLHEGTLRWEIGLSDAKIEQNLNIEGSLNYSSSILRASVSVYQNNFRNYIYLAPMGTEYFGFDVYHFQQANSVLTGGEISAAATLPNTRTELSASYSMIEGKKNDGEYLPFIPANRVTGEIKFRLRPFRQLSDIMLKAGGSYTARQSRPAMFETETSGYWLVHAGVFARWKRHNISLVCNNLFNENYYDHLSRFKYYGIANMGRSIILGIKSNF